jgi:hypothetical protein
MHVDDLPAGRLRDAVRAAAARGHGVPVASPIARPGVRGRNPTTRNRNRYRGARCGTVSTSFAAAERHADGHGGARIDLDLEGAT